MTEYRPATMPQRTDYCDHCEAPWIDRSPWRKLFDAVCYHLFMALPGRLAMHRMIGFRLLPWAGGHAFICCHRQPFVAETTGAS